MKIGKFLAGLVLVGGMALSSEAFAQQSPAEIGKALGKIAVEIGKKSKDCLKTAAFLIKFSKKIESGDLTESQIELYYRLSEKCSDNGINLIDKIEEANELFGDGDDGEGDDGGGDDGGGEAPAMSGFRAAPVSEEVKIKG
jgi:hypothetical protein